MVGLHSSTENTITEQTGKNHKLDMQCRAALHPSSEDVITKKYKSYKLTCSYQWD